MLSIAIWVDRTKRKKVRVHSKILVKVKNQDLKEIKLAEEVDLLREEVEEEVASEEHNDD